MLITLHDSWAILLRLRELDKLREIDIVGWVLIFFVGCALRYIEISFAEFTISLHIMVLNSGTFHCSIHMIMIE